MAIHKVGNFKVEVLHEEHLAEKRIDVLIVVYEGREFLDLVRFDFKGFNSGELLKKLPTLSSFPIQKLSAVIEDARKWPKAKPSSSMKAMGRKKTIRKTGKR